jgi:ubiquinone biosynthesis protein COQ9
VGSWKKWSRPSGFAAERKSPAGGRTDGLKQAHWPRTLTSMSEQDFDHALIAAAFRLAGDSGWAQMTIADAARSAGLSLAEARSRFPGKARLLLRFGQLLDQSALSGASGEGSVRDQLFDLLMGRFEAMKPHRDGVRALMRYLPCDPRTGLLLTCATRRSMRWMLQAAGQPTTGLRGALRVRGLVAVWAWTLRAFERDETEDLSATMAALDTALVRAHQVATWLSGGRVRDAGPDEPTSPDAGMSASDP